jgi:hypothetical protein
MSYNFSSGSLQHEGSFTADGNIRAKSSELSGSSLSIGSAVLSAAELELLDGISAVGTAQTSKVVTVSSGDKITLGAIEIEGSNFDINGGTIDAADITVGASKTLDVSAGTLTTAAAQNLAIMQGAASDVDIGAFDLRAQTVTADGLTSGRVVFAGTNGVLSDDSDFSFATDTLTVTKIGAFEAAGAINFASQAMTNVNVDGGAIDGTTIGAASQSTIKATTISGSGALTIAGNATVAGNILPLGDDASDLGAVGAEFKDLYIDGVAYLDAVQIGTFTAPINMNSQVTTNVNIDSGNIDGATIATSDITVGAGKTLDVSAGTLTLANDQIAAAKVTGLDGLGLLDTDGVLAVQVSGAVKIASDKVGISGSIAGAGLKYDGGVDSISSIAINTRNQNGLDIDGSNRLRVRLDGSGGLNLGSGDGLKIDLLELPGANVSLANDSFALISNENSDSSRRETFSDLMDAMTAASNSGMSVSPLKQLKVDVADLAAVTAIASGDTFAMSQEAEAGDPTKKITFDKMAEKLAGAGLSHAAGVLSVQGSAVALKADGDTLSEGFNYFADANSGVTVSLPASPSVGDVVYVKAKDLTGGGKIVINRQGSHLIDGQESVKIENAFGAVSMVYVVADDWRIF